MRYGLGIDLGTSFASAAIGRTDRVEVVTLGDREAAVPCLVHVDGDGNLSTGVAAARRAGDDRSSTVKEIRRRIGDDTPILVGGTANPPHLLLGHQLRHLVDLVVERQGSRPESIVITHPASWGPFKVERFTEAVTAAGLDGADLVTESLAAATDHAAGNELATGAKVLVVDLGGTSLSTEILQRGIDRLVPVGSAATIDRLGGTDLDQAVFDHVRASVAGAIDDLDRRDPVVVASLHRLRQACAVAKETLSDRTDADIPVSLPGLETVVRITRTEFESAIRPLVANLVAQARRTVTEAGLEPDDLDRIILVGGSAPVPLLREQLAGDLSVEVIVEDHPRFATVRGAARLADPGPTASPSAMRSTPTGDDTGPVGPIARASADDDPTRTSLISLAPTPAGAPASVPAEATGPTGRAGSPLATMAATGQQSTASIAGLGGRARGPLMAAVAIAVVLISGGGAAATLGAGMFGSGEAGTTIEAETTIDPVSTSSPASTSTSSTDTTTRAADGFELTSSSSVATTERTTTTRRPATTHHTTTTHHQTTETTAHHTTTTRHDTTTETTAAETTTSTTEPEPTLTISPQPSITGGFTTLIGPPISPGP